MRPKDCSPLFEHVLDAPSAFTPDDLMIAVRATRHLPEQGVPRICVLDFDGDLTDWLVSSGKATRFESWACFHTTMYEVVADDIGCGLIARTVGGPYAVLVAEQLRAGGAQLILAVTSAGRVSPSLPLPSLVVVTGAVRDEGTSLHYLPPGREVACPTPIAPLLERELSMLGGTVIQGTVWTTDAPYRETKEQLKRRAAEGILAVEMQAASLFAFATARPVNIGIVAHLTNAVDHSGGQFDKGSQEDGLRVLRAMLRAGYAYLEAQALSNDLPVAPRQTRR